ncbi:MAG: ATP-dependent Clp protease proteolytic subunit [Verrucomicrobiales bacterium]|jgi:ATP-dependent Clp protease protease subunit|nr:ATP-dependent Clp protease proteolytic subunit [Verrucomicrobiales bacterium]
MAEPKKEPRKNPSIEERLVRERTIMLFGEINQKIAREVAEKLVAFDADSDAEIKIFINSQGGHVEAGDTIHDMIRFVKAPVKIIGTGWVASAGALIYAAARRENRYSLPNTRFMLHQPSGGVGGQATDISIEAQEILKMRDRLNKIFAEQTGKSVEQIARDSDRNFWMSAEEARAYGLVGKLIRSATEL